MTWEEVDSRKFLDFGHIFTPRRDEIRNTLLGLVPVGPEDGWLAVDLGAGNGWLSEALLQRFPTSRVIALDGSETMLREAARRLSPFGERAEVRPFRLEQSDWLSGLSGVRCFLSSIVLHHLDGRQKQELFTRLFERLEAGGALLIADIVAPASEQERRYLAEEWDEEVKRQSLAFTGNLRAYDFFVEDQWNIYDYPDPGDKPSTLLEQLAWLREAGFEGVSAFWAKAGHAVFGGYKPENP